MAAERPRPSDAMGILAREMILPVRNQLLIVGKRQGHMLNDGDNTFNRMAIRKAGLAPRDVEWTFDISAVKELFYGVRPETGSLPQSLPRGVVVYPYLLDYMHSDRQYPIPTSKYSVIMQVSEACHVPVVNAEQQGLYGTGALADALGRLMAGPFVELPADGQGVTPA